MPILRSGSEVSSVDQESAHQYAPRASVTQNVRYLPQDRAYQRATGENGQTLRKKRRWLHMEHQAGRISGKAFRELRDFYAKSNISKPKSRLPKARDLSNAARLVKQRLNYFLNQRPDASTSSNGDISGHAASGELTNGEALDEVFNNEDDDVVAGEDTELEDDMETDDESSSEGEGLTNHGDHPSLAPDNDELARQRLRDLGFAVRVKEEADD